MNAVNILSDTSDLTMKRKATLKRVMEEPLFLEAVAEVRNDIVNSLMSTPLEKAELREKFYFEARALDMIIVRLTSYANDVEFRKKEEDDAS